MTPLLLALLAAGVLVYSSFSRTAERLPLSPPMFFIALGLLLAPEASGILQIEAGHRWIHGLAELTLVLVLFNDAARIDISCLRREENLPIRLLGIGLPLTIVAGALAAAVCFPAAGVWSWLLLAAILAPTDAALGQAVVSSPLVPVRIRQSLNVESGLNDGLALPVVVVAAALATESAGGLADWLQFAALQVVLGPAVGVAVGYAGGQVLAWATRAGYVNDAFQRISGLALAALAFGAAEVAGGNGFIAAFTAGLTLGNTARQVCDCLFEFGEAEGQLLTLLVFVLFGAVMVPDALRHATPAIFGYALLSLTVVRMLPVAASLAGSGLRGPSTAFLGWFGPRGLASILYVLLIVERGSVPGSEALESAVTVTVLLSALLHGMSAYPFARRFGSWAQRAGDAAAEHRSVPEMPVRIPHASG